MVRVSNTQGPHVSRVARCGQRRYSQVKSKAHSQPHSLAHDSMDELDYASFFTVQSSQKCASRSCNLWIFGLLGSSSVQTYSHYPPPSYFFPEIFPSSLSPLSISMPKSFVSVPPISLPLVFSAGHLLTRLKLFCNLQG